MPTLYTAERCPYAARARIVLAEKGLDYDAVEIDLDDRPAWLYEKNPLGRVPVYEEDGGFVLPESEVIMEYLEERYPEPALWPPDPAERALGRLWLQRFDDRLGDVYYAVRRGTEGARDALDAELGELDRVLEAQPYLTGREYWARRHRLRALAAARDGAAGGRARAVPGPRKLARARRREAGGRG